MRIELRNQSVDGEQKLGHAQASPFGSNVCKAGASQEPTQTDFDQTLLDPPPAGPYIRD